MQYVDREKLASEAQIAADVAFCRVAAMPYPAYDRGLSAWGFVGPVSEAPPGNKLTFESEIYPHGQNIRQRRLIWLRSYREVMVVGEGLLSATGRCLRQRFLATLESNLNRSFSSFPAWAEYWVTSIDLAEELQRSDGGGGRIRTFEVDDGRFTVCSLWPLGNPTRGKHIVRTYSVNGGGGRIIRRFAPHPSGRCRWQRSLAFARVEP